VTVALDKFEGADDSERLECAKDVLKQAFKKPTKSENDFREAFMNREQRENESHALFLAELRNLFDKGFKCLPHQRDSMLQCSEIMLKFQEFLLYLFSHA
jgi:hypothetical protein